MDRLKQYAEENGKAIDIQKLKAGLMSLEDFSRADAHMVMACHDVFIKYSGGILLICRNKKPVIDIPWPVGGRIARGMSTEDSLRASAFRECGLKLKNLKHLGTARVMLGTDHLGHHKGSDAISVVYYAEGEGELILDKDHYNPTIISKRHYNQNRKDLHPYVREYMDMAIQL